MVLLVLVVYHAVYLLRLYVVLLQTLLVGLFDFYYPVGFRLHSQTLEVCVGLAFVDASSVDRLVVSDLGQAVL